MQPFLFLIKYYKSVPVVLLLLIKVKDYDSDQNNCLILFSLKNPVLFLRVDNVKKSGSRLKTNEVPPLE